MDELYITKIVVDVSLIQNGPIQLLNTVGDVLYQNNNVNSAIVIETSLYREGAYMLKAGNIYRAIFIY
ncbi:hypothetical protein [Wenyingzhuangia sp. 2_MG-2023]|uniref:hypothetical protein n=1 Tax=Wenyingzhuangia sp. 2_MG-2023 TaxID=3062639 RepID=UPI0026E41D4E|nr:hypothetical protein [Wenyingzhuangia sp. 2_MG-2023]MDO6739171.1 hypothetical protein [Wenyingzhuangia sp. 2_MG-2023]MDO6803668.1 hypothetical protein [Wenyingzhuangia sp. 1_MG-2023]